MFLNVVPSNCVDDDIIPSGIPVIVDQSPPPPTVPLNAYRKSSADVNCADAENNPISFITLVTDCVNVSAN